MNNLKEYLTIYLKGVAMGSADAVPGVSGGTIALITGIYDRLIQAITSIRPCIVLGFLKSILLFDFDSAKTTFSRMDGKFLAILGTGIISAVILMLRLINLMLQQIPVKTFGFFFGLIAVSAGVLLVQAKLTTPQTLMAAISGFFIAFTISGYATTSLGHGLPIVFLSGVVAGSAMILPGVSGSLMLLILGQYEHFSELVTRFTDGVVSGFRGDFAIFMQTSPDILVFLVGAGTGVLTLAHSLKLALERYREVTFTFLVSLVLGALRAPLVEVGKILGERGTGWMTVFPEFSLAALAGGLLVYLIDRKAGLVEF